MSIHTHHRARMKARFAKEGLDGFNEHQVLELLLFYCIPRRDTNEIAHRLIERFGSLCGVLDAPVKELQKVEGIGANAATFISLLKCVERYYKINAQPKNIILDDIDSCGDYILPYFDGKDKETVFLLCLDAKCKVLCCRELEEGSVNSANISIRKIVDIALTENATSVVLAHNHPSGLAIPSREDVHTTKKLSRALSFVDVVLMDHVIVAEGDFVSLVHSGMYSPNEYEE